MTDDLPGDERSEYELRARFHQAVGAVEPDPAALGRIRAAVPRRRARHRNAWTGAAAVTLLAVATVPALHAARPLDLPGGPAAESAEAVGPPARSVSGGGLPGGPYTVPVPAVPGGGKVTASAGGSAPPSPAASVPGGPAPVETVPVCARADLGRGTAHLDDADGAGNVYGSFTVRNTSARSCVLAGPGLITAIAGGSADQTRIKVADHVTGDAAAALPPAPAAPAVLVLVPGAGYRVRFGWVPDGLGCTVPADGARAVVAEASSDDGAPVVQSGPVASGEDPSPTGTPATPGPSVTVAHIPEGGTPEAAGTVITGGCGGTVYRAAPEAVPSEPPSTTPSPG